MNYQPNQILKSFNSATSTSYYLVVNVYPKYLELRDISTGTTLRPSTNSVFLQFSNLVGTADSHPELLI